MFANSVLMGLLDTLKKIFGGGTSEESEVKGEELVNSEDHFADDMQSEEIASVDEVQETGDAVVEEVVEATEDVVEDSEEEFKM